MSIYISAHRHPLLDIKLPKASPQRPVLRYQHPADPRGPQSCGRLTDATPSSRKLILCCRQNGQKVLLIVVYCRQLITYPILLFVYVTLNQSGRIFCRQSGYNFMWQTGWSRHYWPHCGRDIQMITMYMIGYYTSIISVSRVGKYFPGYKHIDNIICFNNACNNHIKFKRTTRLVNTYYTRNNLLINNVERTLNSFSIIYTVLWIYNGFSIYVINFSFSKISCNSTKRDKNLVRDTWQESQSGITDRD